MEVEVPISEKYALTMKEAVAYFNIGEKKLVRLSDEHEGKFTLFNGSKRLIIRAKFEKFLEKTMGI